MEIKPFEEINRKIYAYTLPEVPSRDGYIKIGETHRKVESRIKEQLSTVGLKPNILFTRPAMRIDGTWFNDRDLHQYLINKGHYRELFLSANEWFYFNGNPEEAEILTDEYINTPYDKIQISKEGLTYELRDEQRACVDATYEYYKKVIDSKNLEEKKFLWNAKPRFGKTLTSYDFILRIKAVNTLIVTNRPAIANSWYDDFRKFISHKLVSEEELYIRFISETDSLKGKCYTREEYQNNTDLLEKTYGQITFLSLQDLKGAKFAGGDYDKLEWVRDTNWDLLIIDEAHEGIETEI